MTHDVTNQSPPFEDINLFTSDISLREAVEREGAAASLAHLENLGSRVGSKEAFERGRLASAYPPRLRLFDAKGYRIDQVDFHPAYHECMAFSMAEGLHCSSWSHLANRGAIVPGTNVVRAAGSYMAAQMEPGHCCPITMTNAAVATLIQAPTIAKPWLSKVLQRTYDPTFRPINEKASATIGMGMTEKQGGTDVRLNTTYADAISRAGPGQEYRLTGHKWFMSAPMCDAFLVLAQTQNGLSCFLMPRILPDGSVNPILIQQLKEKLGNRSNASSQVEFKDTHAWLIGEEGRGIATIMDMVTFTRLDCAISSAGLMRLCLANALHHCHYRFVFGKPLIEQAMMRHLLADLALDVEAATALAFRLARAFDFPNEAGEVAWRRVMTPVTKYWNCKIAPALSYEAMECLGGNGYVEEEVLARTYRELPVNAIWEGSGNVLCLDVLRVLLREPDAAELVFNALEDGASAEPRLSRQLEWVRGFLHRPSDIEANARSFVEGLALLAAGCLLNAHAPAAVADAFIASRLGGRWRNTYGAGLGGADAKAIVTRAWAG